MLILSYNKNKNNIDKRSWKVEKNEDEKMLQAPGKIEFEIASK